MDVVHGLRAVYGYASRGDHCRVGLVFARQGVPNLVTLALDDRNRDKITFMSSIQEILEDVKFGEDGLIPAILQDADTRQVLMQAYMNRASLKKTLQTGLATFWSRSRQSEWVKGATSGHFQRVIEARIDCDGDSLLFLVTGEGPACHTGEDSCFFRKIHRPG